MSTVVGMRSVHLIGADTTPAQQERLAGLQVQPPAELIRLAPQPFALIERLSEILRPSDAASGWLNADVLHVWSRGCVPDVLRQVRAAGARTTVVLQLDTGLRLAEVLRPYFEYPDVRMRFLCVSEALRRACRREGIAPQHVGVVPEALSPIPPTAERPALRHALGLAPDHFAVLLAPPLGHSVQAGLWGALMASRVHDPLRVVIVGTDEEAERAARFVRAVGGDDWCLRVPTEAWPAVALAADAGVHVVDELLPHGGMLELIRAGAALVLHDSPDMREILPGDSDALYLPEVAPAAIAHAVLSLIEAPERRAALADAARQRLGRFEAPPVRAQWEREVQRLLHSK